MRVRNQPLRRCLVSQRPGLDKCGRALIAVGIELSIALLERCRGVGHATTTDLYRY